MRTIRYDDLTLELGEADSIRFMAKGAFAIYYGIRAVCSVSHPSSGFLDVRRTQKARYFDPNVKNNIALMEMIEDVELRRRCELLVDTVETIEHLYQSFIDFIAVLLNIHSEVDPKRVKLRDKVNRYARRYGPAWVREAPYQELLHRNDEAWQEADAAKKFVDERLEELIRELDAQENEMK